MTYNFRVDGGVNMCYNKICWNDAGVQNNTYWIFLFIRPLFSYHLTELGILFVLGVFHFSRRLVDLLERVVLYADCNVKFILAEHIM
jgi:hypothetical protein